MRNSAYLCPECFKNGVALTDHYGVDLLKLRQSLIYRANPYSAVLWMQEDNWPKYCSFQRKQCGLIEKGFLRKEGNLEGRQSCNEAIWNDTLYLCLSVSTF